MFAIAYPPKVGGNDELLRSRIGQSSELRRFRTVPSEWPAFLREGSQASLCNAFVSILEVFSRYGNSHGPGAGTHTRVINCGKRGHTRQYRRVVVPHARLAGSQSASRACLWPPALSERRTSEPPWAVEQNMEECLQGSENWDHNPIGMLS